MKKMEGSDRKSQLLDAGAKAAAKHGAANVTRKMVADAAKVSEALVSAYFGSMNEAKAAFKKHAKKLGLTLPDKDKEAELGSKLRAHGPRTAKTPAPSENKPVAPKKATAPAPSENKPAKKKPVAAKTPPAPVAPPSLPPVV